MRLPRTALGTLGQGAAAATQKLLPLPPPNRRSLPPASRTLHSRPPQWLEATPHSCLFHRLLGYVSRPAEITPRGEGDRTGTALAGVVWSHQGKGGHHRVLHPQSLVRATELNQDLSVHRAVQGKEDRYPVDQFMV